MTWSYERKCIQSKLYVNKLRPVYRDTPHGLKLNSRLINGFAAMQNSRDLATAIAPIFEHIPPDQVRCALKLLPLVFQKCCITGIEFGNPFQAGFGHKHVRERLTQNADLPARALGEAFF